MQERYTTTSKTKAHKTKKKNPGGITIKYIRFHGNYSSPYTKQPYGIFVVIYHLLRDGKLSDEDAILYNKTNDWFEENLPNPPFYDDQNSIRAVTWFKQTENAKEMMERLAPFFDLAKKYKVEIIKSESEVIPGQMVYEDEYQIGVVNRIV